MKRKKIINLPVSLSFFLSSIAHALPMIGGDRVERTAIGVGDYLIQLGPVIMIISLAVAGISLAMGSRDGAHRAMLGVVGGLVITLAKDIVDIAQSLAGGLGILF